MGGPGGKLDFAPGFVTARDDVGRVVRFTRAERAILSTLATRPGMIFSRQRLLDIIAGEGSDSGDRSIDFVVNRLRRKLGDAARSPRYIATQYGEGYWWIPQVAPPDAGTANAFVVVGPIRVIPPAHVADGRVLLFAEMLRAALDRQTAPERTVVLDADCPNVAAFGDARPSYAVELDALAPGDRLDCAITAREFASGRVLHVSRLTLEPVPAADDVEALAGDVVAALWRATTRGAAPAPDAKPLPLRMHDAGLQLAASTTGVEVEQRLRATLAADPDDYETRLMLATGIHSRFIMGGAAQFMADPYTAPLAACDELEQLVTAAIPHIEDDPIHMMAAAKLLYFLDRGHDRVAMSMAERGLAGSTAIIAALTVVGQMRQYDGDIVGGAELLERALAMGERGTVFSAYLYSIRLNGALASGEKERIERAYTELIADQPPAVPHFELHCAGYLDMSDALRQRVAGHDARSAAALVRYSHFTQGRLFKRENHRSNYMRGVLLAFCRAQGADFVPGDIKRNLPTLFAEDGSLRE